MTPKEKIQFVKNMILEKAQISPAGLCRIDLYDILDVEVIKANNGIPDEAPIVLSRADQLLIIEKLEAEGFLKEVWPIDKDSYWVETSNKTMEAIDKPEKTTYLDSGFDHNLIRAQKTPSSEQFFEINRKLDSIANKVSENNHTETFNSKSNYLKSLDLITESVVVKDVIFLVIDKRYEMPFRFNTKNNEGRDAYIKKLHDIAYLVNAPGKMVIYDKKIADNINNGLFKKRGIKSYMKSNSLKKPTLVAKSESGDILVLKNEIPVITATINVVPSQYRQLYIDKTK